MDKVSKPSGDVKWKYKGICTVSVVYRPLVFSYICIMFWLFPVHSKLYWLMHFTIHSYSARRFCHITQSDLPHIAATLPRFNRVAQEAPELSWTFGSQTRGLRHSVLTNCVNDPKNQLLDILCTRKENSLPTTMNGLSQDTPDIEVCKTVFRMKGWVIPRFNPLVQTTLEVWIWI